MERWTIPRLVMPPDVIEMIKPRAGGGGVRRTPLLWTRLPQGVRGSRDAGAPRVHPRSALSRPGDGDDLRAFRETHRPVILTVLTTGTGWDFPERQTGENSHLLMASSAITLWWRSKPMAAVTLSCYPDRDHPHPRSHPQPRIRGLVARWPSWLRWVLRATRWGCQGSDRW